MRRAVVPFPIPAAAAVTLVILFGAGCAPGATDPDPGVALALAERRAATIADLSYDLRLDIPASRDSAVTGTVAATFTLRSAGEPLVLDFRAPADHVLGVRLDGDPVAHRVVPDHIVIPAEALRARDLTVEVDFRSTDAALNRNDEFLYALFVPDRASTAVPVFEQPDLKARWTVALAIPAAWRAVANGALVSRDSGDASRHLVRFAPTEPISTYLVSFAAGLLREERAERDGRTFTLYHRETDDEKVLRNLPAIFDLHAAALRWMEDYTGIAYPFGKFDFFAVPAFQFGGMEHPGAIWYRADALFLDRTASRNQELGRASLIAHETAHMWFGDLVTMRWFNDVWMKEVFANFYAAKIARPSFPDVDHALRFFQAHHPAAYAVDRTPGANPIRQPLENQRDAGSLYGAVIYQKAPIAMQQLEQLVGEATFREGMRQYLQRHRFGNAAWPDLVAILDALTDEDLAAWSRVWIEAPGRPVIGATRQDSTLVIVESDPWAALAAAATGSRRGDREAPAARALRWPQYVTFALGQGDSVALMRLPLRGEVAGPPRTRSLPLPPGLGRVDWILPGVDGLSYARFALDSASREELLRRVPRLGRPMHRAVAWQTLHEELLDGNLDAAAFIGAGLDAIAAERDELVAAQVVGLVRGAYWRFLPDSARRTLAPRVERTLWTALEAAPTPGRKGTFFGALVSMTLTPEGTARLARVWRQEETPRGLPLAEPQYIALAEALAIRGVPETAAILEAQEARITNPDRRARFRFVRPALGADVAARRALVASFRDVANRRRESWVLDAMGLVNHPLRAAEALPDLRANLDLVEEIQRTGDIFFPLRWLNATLDGHQSAEAADAVRAYLAANPDLPPRLRGKVLQAADDLYRAARVVDGWGR